GATYLSPAVSATIMSGLSEPDIQTEEEDQLISLTRREKQLLQLICEGHTNSEMAEIMHISVKTVERHRSNLMSKLNVNNLVGLIRVAIRHGLVIIDE
ncbi:MAG: response regulator transcription factor, partial [Anaerolineales bacterium]|nr:response regulator transcription factor [Anaerolineales bacterium]